MLLDFIMKKKLIVLSGVVMGAAPVMALANALTGQVQTCGSGGSEGLGTNGGIGIGQIICQIGGFLQTIIPIAITLGIVLFIWGVAMYVIAADEEAKTKGRDKMIYGIIGLAIIVGLWGIINVLNKTFGLQNATYVPVVPVIGQ